MIPPEVYSMDAVDDLKNLRYFEVQELWYEEMQKDLNRGRSTCTKLLKERGLDLDHLFDDGVLPSGLPLELQDWLTCYLAADMIGARLERMRPLVQSQENKSAQKTSLSRGAYPILAHSGSVTTEGKLQSPVVRQPPPFDEADIVVVDPKSLASQRLSQPQTSPAAIASSLPAYREEETAPLIPKANPSTAMHAADNLRRRDGTPVPGQTENAVVSDWSGFAFGGELLT